MILLTTSYRPTSRVRSLCNELADLIPNLVRVNRGKMSLIKVAEKSVQLNSEKIIIIDRWKGGPGRIRLFKIIGMDIKEVPPRLYISGVKLRREFEAPKEKAGKIVVSSLFLNESETEKEEVKMLRNSLSGFLEIPIFKFGEKPSAYQAYLNISDGHDCFAILSFFILPSNVEVGPRLKISHVTW